MKRAVISPVTIFAAGIGFALIMPMFVNQYTLFVGNIAFIYVILALGLNLLLGYTGLLAFVNAALFGIGAYSMAIARTKFGIPYGIALPIAGLTTLALGILVALPALRLSGLYLALASVSFAQFASWAFAHWDPVTGGPTGIRVAAIAYGTPGSWETTHYYVCLAIAVALVIITSNILRSRIGRSFVAIRESEVAAEGLAIDLTRTKTLAYGLSALYAGIAGGLFAPILTLVVPESYDLFQVIVQFAMVVVGGLGSITGAVLGAIGLITLQEALRATKELQEIAFGGMILLTVLFLPKGIAGLIQKYVPEWREPLRRRRGGR
jgi:branched-chain amino acid transport system permease protein